MLGEHGLACVSGWYSGRLARGRTVDEEIEAVGPHLEQLAHNGAKVMVYGEVADSIQGAPQPLYQRPRFTSDGAVARVRRAAEPRSASTCCRKGVRLAYHHHMGAYVETPDDVDQLMASPTTTSACCSTPAT